MLNNLYTREWRLFHNFFCPSVKLIAKERIGSKTVTKLNIVSERSVFLSRCFV
jgi:hypothetical protein